MTEAVPEGRLETLSVLRAGDVGTIAEIDASQDMAKRLADIGFVRDARVEMLRSGTPCLVRIGPPCVGLGRANQRCILLSRTVQPKSSSTEWKL